MKKKRDKYFMKKEKHQGMMYFVIYERTFFNLINTPYDYYLDEDLSLLVTADLNSTRQK